MPCNTGSSVLGTSDALCEIQIYSCAVLGIGPSLPGTGVVRVIELRGGVFKKPLDLGSSSLVKRGKAFLTKTFRAFQYACLSATGGYGVPVPQKQQHGAGTPLEAQSCVPDHGSSWYLSFDFQPPDM